MRIGPREVEAQLAILLAHRTSDLPGLAGVENKQMLIVLNNSRYKRRIQTEEQTHTDPTSVVVNPVLKIDWMVWYRLFENRCDRLAIPTKQLLDRIEVHLVTKAIVQFHHPPSSELARSHQGKCVCTSPVRQPAVAV